jgi:hypothetical protein
MDFAFFMLPSHICDATDPALTPNRSKIGECQCPEPVVIPVSSQFLGTLSIPCTWLTKLPGYGVVRLLDGALTGLDCQ